MPRDTCYYDGHCGMCRRSVRCIRRLDWLGRINFHDMTTTPDLPVGLDLAMTGLPMRTGDGRVLIGYPAVRRALMQTPLGILFAWAMYLPGISHLGRRIYRHIADNRQRDIACSLPTIPPGARPRSG